MLNSKVLVSITTMLRERLAFGKKNLCNFSLKWLWDFPIRDHMQSMSITFL